MKRKLFILFVYYLIFVAFFVSTELFAFLCHYNPLLGPKDFWITYEPFHLFYWAFTLQVKGSQFIIAFSVLFSLITIISVTAVILYRKFDFKKRDLYGSSRWMSNAELKKLGLLNPGGIVLGQTNTARYHHNEKRDSWKLLKSGQLLFNASPEHVLVVAPTRRGKGINFVIPTLLSWIGSVVVYDIKKENFDVTSGWRRKFSHVIRFEPAALYSARFNPLLEIEKGPKEIAHTQNIADILCDPNGKGESDHWQKTAHQLLVGVILHVLYVEEDKTLYGVFKFINNPNLNIQQTLKKMLETNHINGKPHEVVAQTARNMLNKADKELSGVVSSASSYLSLYQDPYIQRNTSVSDFYIKDLMNSKNPMSLYLVVSPSDADRMRPLVRLMLQMIGKKLTEKLGGNKHKLLFLIDEFPTLGNLTFFETQLAFFAGYGIKCALITQSFNQLYKYYSNNTSIMDNCRVKLILGADDTSEAKKISDFLGQETLIRKNKSMSGKTNNLLMNGKSVSESEVGRSLMTPDEVLRLPFDDILLLSGGVYPYKGKKIMYYQDHRFKDRANLPRPETEEEQRKEFIQSEKSPWLQRESTSIINNTEKEFERILTQKEIEPIIPEPLKEADEIQEKIEHQDRSGILNDY